MALPFLALVYLVYPRGSVARILRSPLIKFVNHSASIAIFLILLLIASTDGQSVKALESRQMTRGPDPNRIELLIAWWMLHPTLCLTIKSINQSRAFYGQKGFVWSEMKQIWEEGFKAYVRQWWNWLDFIMLTLFLTTVGLRVVGLILRKTQRYGFDLAGREDWPPDDPTLVSEAFFAIAHIFSFARIIFLFQVNEHLGPLQISLGNMLIDITKFLFIFLLVITSFACGLHQLYYYYFSADNDMRPAAFSSLLRSYQALFWHLFGVTQINQYRLQTKDAEGKVVDLKSAQVTVTNQADTEWKFARSKLWLGYFDEGSTLPPPLNTIVSPKSIWRFGRGLIRLLTCSTTFASVTDDKSKSPLYRDHPRHRRRYSGTVKPFPPNQANSTTGNRSLWCDHSVEPTIRLPSSVNNENSKPLASNATDTPAALKEENTSSKKSGKKHSYQAITRILVRRYIHVSKKTMRQGIVNEDDLLEIKQDISSLRYELREDRQREVVRSIGHLEGLKYQLLSVLVPHHQQGQENCSTKGSSSSSSAASRPPQPPSHSVGSNETASIPGIKALGAQIQALSEEIRRISPGPNTPPLLSGLQATTATSEGLKGLKHEIIDEVKGELHSFARQLMQFMSQCQQPSGSNSGSETPAAPSVSANAPLSTSSLSPPRAPAPASSTPSINRERIGGVSVTYRGGAAAGLSLSAPRRAQPRHQR
uniref:TRP transient receptor potential channel n=1 Tax=Echinococcus granulosus TaxID=6210 RepID=A0A068WNE6_ECHGR|nr:TRP transient receptor potential channel [Echinococcus granulosus]